MKLISFTHPVTLGIDSLLRIENIFDLGNNGNILIGFKDTPSTLWISNGGFVNSSNIPIGINNGSLVNYSFPLEIEIVPLKFNKSMLPVFNGLQVIIDEGGTLNIQGLTLKGSSVVRVVNGGDLSAIWNEIQTIGSPYLSFDLASQVIVQNATVQFGNPVDLRVNTHITFVNVPIWLLDNALLSINGTGTAVFMAPIHMNSSLATMTVHYISTLIIQSVFVLDGFLRVAQGASLLIDTNATVIGKGTANIWGDATVKASLDIGRINFYSKVFVTGNDIFFHEAYFYQNSNFSNAIVYFDLLIVQAGILFHADGLCIFSGTNTGVGSSMNGTSNSIFQVSGEGEWHISNYSSVGIDNLDVLIDSTYASFVVDSGTLVRFYSSALFLEEGLIVFNNGVLFEFIAGYGIQISSGILRVGNPTTIIGDVVNEGGLITGLPSGVIISNVEVDEVYTLYIEGNFSQSSNGQLYIRRSGIGASVPKNNSVLVVDSCYLDGLIQIKSDEGLQVGDKFLIMERASGSSGQLVILSSVVVQGNFAEDPPLTLQMDGNQIFVVAVGSTSPVSTCSFHLPSTLFLLLSIFISVVFL